VFAQAAALRIEPQRIAVGGDSAGANLATVTSIILRDSGDPAPRFQLLFYPGTDLSQFTTPSHIELADGYLLTRDVMIYFRANYAREEDWRDWRASPLFAPSLAGLPPAYLMTAGFDPLRDEGKAYADAMAAAGVPVEYECYDSMIHGFITMGGFIAQANEAVSRAAAVLARALA
jgi:acetyl esterase